MASAIIYTNPLTPGTAQFPVYVVGDDQNWSFQFNNGANFWNPTGVTLNIGYVKGLPNATYASAFQWVDRMNNIHTGSFVIGSGLPTTLTWDENPIGFDGTNGAWLLKGRVPPCNGIRKVYVKYGGTGTSTAPAVRFRGGATETGQRATATATVSAGDVTALTLTTGGRGYSGSNPPEVIITGDGTGSVWKVTVSTGSAEGEIIGFTKVKVGTGYTTATVTVVDAEATATATVGGTSGVTGLTVTNPGMSYTSAPTVAIAGSSISGATATAALLNSTWGLSGLTITNAGTVYLSAPTVSFSGGTGTGAAATATISGNGGVANVAITNSGAYACGDPNQLANVSASFSGGAGTGAAGTCIFTQDSGAPNYWRLTGVTITNSGSGYTSTPTFAVGSLSSLVTVVVAAAGTSVLTTGIVTALTLTNPGSGYGATAPTVTITAPGGGGITATATAQLIGSPISPVLTITAAGSGATAPPLVSFSGGAGSGAAATALVTLGITAITMVQTGYAYTSLPSLSCVPDTGAVLIPGGIESHSAAFLQSFSPATAQGAITVTPFTSGRRDTSGNLIYDDSLLIVRPRYILQPTLTLQADGLTWAGVFTPVNAFVNAVLAYRRSVTADVQIFGGGRLLYQGSLTINAA